MITNQQFENFRKRAFENKPLMREVQLNDINVIDDETIEYRGVQLKLVPAACNDLRTLLGMPKQFANQLSKTYGEEVRTKLRAFCKRMRVVTGKNPTVTLVVNSVTRHVERLMQDNRLVSVETYFELFEKIMNQGKFDIRQLNAGSDGSLSISLISKTAEFQVGNFADEVFHPGLNLKNSLNKGAFVDSFMDRLVCGNGMTTPSFTGNDGEGPIVIGGGDFTDIHKFHSQIDNLIKGGFFPKAFMDTVTRARVTRASLAEVRQGAKLITANSDLKDEFIDKFVPVNEIHRKLATKGLDWAKLNINQQQNTITNITVWDVINGVTDFASHDYGYNVTDNNRLFMQTSAGSMFAKKNYDTMNLVPVRLD